MSSNAKKKTVSLCYIRFKRGAPSRKRITCAITCTITRAAIAYQQIDIGNIANDIYGFTIDYDKFIRLRCIMRGRKSSLMQIIFHPELYLSCHYFAKKFMTFFIDCFIGIWTVFALPLPRLFFCTLGCCKKDGSKERCNPLALYLFTTEICDISQECSEP